MHELCFCGLRNSVLISIFLEIVRQFKQTKMDINKVELYIYDLSQGLAAKMSPIVIGNINDKIN